MAKHKRNQVEQNNSYGKSNYARPPPTIRWRSASLIIFTTSFALMRSSFLASLKNSFIGPSSNHSALTWMMALPPSKSDAVLAIGLLIQYPKSDGLADKEGAKLQMYPYLSFTCSSPLRRAVGLPSIRVAPFAWQRAAARSTLGTWMLAWGRRPQLLLKKQQYNKIISLINTYEDLDSKTLVAYRIIWCLE